MTVGSLFSGIGGFDLGFERAGFEIKWQVEIDPFCRAVLAKHFPIARRHDDVRETHGVIAHGRGGVDRMWKLAAEHGWQFKDVLCGDCLERVDVLVGGFPCQDISFAGDGAGLAGARSGLWSEYLRLIRELRPRYVVVENVAALIQRGLDTVLGDLAGSGFDAEWSVVSACSVGAPHVRRRLFIVAYSNGEHGRAGFRDSVARAFRPLQAFDGFTSARASYGERLADPSALYRDADGVSDGLDRNRSIGNSIVPQIAEWIARRILEAENQVGVGA